MKSVYEYTDYRDFLRHSLPVDGPGRGARNRLAVALNCQKGFVSQVLGSRSHFSLEHGIKISRFLKLDAEEEEYFLLLLHLARAGSKELEAFYSKRLSEIRQRRQEIKGRIPTRSRLTEAQQLIYYSSWHYSAIHMCLMIPELRSRAAITEYLGLPLQLVNRVLDFLTSAGLASQSGGRLDAGPARIHLGHDSPLIAKHHTNWRMRAIESLDSPDESDLHYSLVMSLSEKAAQTIRETLLKTIQEIEPVLKAAEDKTVYVLGIDLFGLRK